jgi:hypothetical protein
MMKEKELPPVSRDEARRLSEEAFANFMSAGGEVQVLKGRKNPKPVSARGKSNSGMKVRSDPTARFPKKES